MSITLSTAAEKRFAQQVKDNQALALRVATKSSGCSGLSYVLDFAYEIEDDDQEIEFESVRVLIDAKSIENLNGLHIDYVSEGLNQAFKFSNPRATDECGCGESFAIKTSSLSQ